MLILTMSIALLILYISRINFRKIYLGLKINGPFPLPFFGNALMLFNKTPADFLTMGLKLHTQYGDIFRFWVKSDLYVMLSDPNAVEVLLSSPKYIEKADTYKFLKPWLNEGLLLSNGSKWFQRRKILTPAFHFEILQKFLKIFDRQSSIFAETLYKYNESDKVDMFSLIGLCTLDIICETAMGVEINDQSNSQSEYVLAVKKIAHVLHVRMCSFILREDLFFRFSALYKEQTRALKTLHDFTDNIIHERRQKLLAQENDGNFVNNSNKSIGDKRKMNFLDILLQSTNNGKPLSNSDIREEVDTFMFEGHDTTTSALTFCLYCIAKHPEVQQKCFEEIKNVLGYDRSIPVTSNDLNKLFYLDLVVKETLRLFPSVPLIARTLHEELTVGKVTYPKGAEVVISVGYIGRHPKLYQYPHEFRPERFLEDRKQNSKLFSYIPFSAGPRNCIGQKFAILEIKSFVSKMLRYFEISLAKDAMPTLLAELTLIPAHPINFHVKPRLWL